MESIVAEKLSHLSLSPKETARTKNFFALGIVYWLYGRATKHTEKWLQQKFAKNPKYLEANIIAFKAGWSYAAESELLPIQYQVGTAKLESGT